MRAADFPVSFTKDVQHLVFWWGP